MTERTARDIMTTRLVTVAPDDPVTEAAQRIVEAGVGALPVLDGDALAGIVTESDLIMQDVKLEYPTYLHLLDGFIMYPPAVSRFEDNLRKATAAKVADVMTSEPVTVSPDVSVSDVATLLVERDISRVLVVDETGKLVGVVSKHDIVKALAEEDS